MANVHATGLRAALWRCDLGVELPNLAVWDRRHPTQNGSTRPTATRTGAYTDTNKTTISSR